MDNKFLQLKEEQMERLFPLKTGPLMGGHWWKKGKKYRARRIQVLEDIFAPKRTTEMWYKVDTDNPLARRWIN